MKHIGPQLRKLRLLNDKKQEELADFLNIQQQQYSKMERGETKDVKMEHVYRLAKFYNVPVNLFFEE